MMLSKKSCGSEAAIQRRVAELGDEITQYYRQQGVEDIIVICVLNGAVIFFSDLIRHLDLVNTVWDFTRVKSYGDDAISSGQISILKDIETNIKGKHVLLVEDIIDTGITLNQLVKVLYSREPLSIRTCAFLDKVDRRITNLEVDFKGYEIRTSS